jgi:hypothetical protein
VLAERADAAERITELSFTELLRRGADAGLVANPQAWREWRELRNATSHAYNEKRAQAVADRVAAFSTDAAALLAAREQSGEC